MRLAVCSKSVGQEMHASNCQIEGGRATASRFRPRNIPVLVFLCRKQKKLFRYFRQKNRVNVRRVDPVLCVASSKARSER